MIRNALPRLYADLLVGKVVGSGAQLNSIGGAHGRVGDWQPGRLNDILEFWPLDKHWAKGEFTDRTVGQDHHFGHVAFTTDKSFDQLAAIAAKHKVDILEEERGLPHLVPVIYDHEGNFVEFFSPDDQLPTAGRAKAGVGRHERSLPQHHPLRWEISPTLSARPVAKPRRAERMRRYGRK